MGKRLRVEEQRAQEQVGAPPSGTEVKIAVDLSRSKWVDCVRWQGAERLRLSTGGEIKHLQALVRRYPGCPVHLAFEACGFGYELAWWAQHEQIAVTVIAPSQMERPPGLQVKTDRLDVGRMARQLEDGALKGIYVPERAGHERRQVVRPYGQAVKERQRAQVRMRSLRHILELGDVRRFPTADSIGHYLGLTPSEHSSGDTLQRGHLVKCGPGRLRAALLQCGWASVRKGGDPTLRAVYDRLTPRTGKKRAIIAVTRRRVVRLRARGRAVLEESRAAAA
jgi:Transposase IS116/IS110/IS902 family